MPDPLEPGETLQAQVDAEDPDGDTVTFRHQWLVNGEPLAGAVHSTLLPSLLKRGDRLSVRVVPLDAKVEGAPVESPPAIMPNTPPAVTRITLMPGEPHVGDRVQVEVESHDQDQDAVTYLFRWYRNGRPVEGGAGDTARLETAGFLRGDVLMVEVTPQDAFNKGRPFHSPALTIINSHPAITSSPASAIREGLYEYAVQATDPEGDPLTYALETAPAGMVIDKTSGRIQWQVPADVKGTQRVRVGVRDNRDGYAFQEFDLAIAPSS